MSTPEDRRQTDDAARRALGATLEKALRLHQAGRAAEAEPLYREVLAVAPRHADALHLLGIVCLQGRRWEEAAALIGQAVAINDRDAAYRCNLGTALRELGRWAEAVEAYAGAVRLAPDHLDAHYNLGVTLQDMGRLPEAAVHFREALRIRPEHAEARYRHGTVARGLGMLREAADDFRAVTLARPDTLQVRIDLAATLMALGDRKGAAAQYAAMLCFEPSHADALIDLGNGRQDDGRLAEAVVLYRRALRAAPDHPLAHYNLAGALQGQGRPNEAVAGYRAALRVRPENPEALYNLGVALQALNQSERAVEAYRAALRLAPAYPRALHGLAHTLTELGDFAGARRQFERALAAAPDDPCSWAGLASLGRMTEADRPWFEHAGALLARGPDDQGAMFLHYAMGKFGDDTGDFDAAFGHFGQANAIARRHATPYDPAEMEAAVSRIIAHHDAAFFGRLRDHGSESERPCFIIGMPRSGTTLVEQIIASHPDGFGAGELSYWNDLVDRHLEPVLTGRLTGTDIAGFADGFLATLNAVAPGSARVVDKMPGNFLWLGPIHAAFPRARILHMRRDPLDVCLSIYFQNFVGSHRYAYDLGDIAHYYRQYHRLMGHWRRVLPADTLLDVPYEAMVDDTAGWARRIIGFLGLDWDERCLRFHDTERRVATASAWQVRQPIYATSKRRWRHYEKFLGPTIEALGDLATS